MGGVARFVCTYGASLVLLYACGLLLSFFILLAPLIEPFPLRTGLIAVMAFVALGLAMSAAERRYALMLLGAAVVLWASLHGQARRQELADELQRHLSARGRAGAAAIVTGSTDGIGFAIGACTVCVRLSCLTQTAAKALVGHGWYVFVHGRSLDKVKRTAVLLNGEAAGGGRAIAVAAGDMASFAAVSSYSDAVMRHARGRDVELLVLNAGLARTNLTLTMDGFDTLMQVNCLAGALLEQLLRKHLREQPFARVVHVSSLSSMSATTDADEAANLTWTPPDAPDDSAYGRTKLVR